MVEGGGLRRTPRCGTADLEHSKGVECRARQCGEEGACLGQIGPWRGAPVGWRDNPFPPANRTVQPLAGKSLIMHLPGTEAGGGVRRVAGEAVTGDAEALVGRWGQGRVGT